MKIYSNDIITRYVACDDIKGFSIEELENDKEFMKQVIEFTDDKNFYKLCSDSIKHDYEFTSFVISKYKDDLDFITSVGDEFILNTGNILEKIEMSLTLLDIISKTDSKKCEKYQMITDNLYIKERIDIELFKMKSTDYYVSREIGMGFLHMFDLYNSSEIVMNFFARKTVDEILSDKSIELKQFLFNNYKNIDELKEKGINNFLINFVTMYDEMLSAYLSTHCDGFTSLAKRTLSIAENIYKRDAQDEQARYNEMFDVVHMYMELSHSQMDENVLIYYLGKELGITSKLKTYDITFDSSLDDDFKDEDIEQDFIKSLIISSDEERYVYDSVKGIMLNTLKICKRRDVDEQGQHKLIKVNFRKPYKTNLDN